MNNPTQKEAINRWQVGYTSIIETAIGETITTVNPDKSKLVHKAVKDTDHRFACDYCSLRDYECSILKCSADERTDGSNMHYELIKPQTVMKTNALAWYKFFQTHKCEYHWYDEICIVFMSFHQIEAFIEKIGNPYNDFLEEGGIECKWQGDSLAIDFAPICEYYGISAEEIFNKEK